MTEQPQTPIPYYNLYGEIGDLPDIVHCEGISARAVLHDWHIKPHRHARLHQFFFVHSGGGHCDVDGQRIVLTPPQLINIPPRTAHGFIFDAGTKGWVITVPREVLEQSIVKELAADLNTIHQTTPSPTLIALFDDLAHEHSARRFARAHILQSLIMLLAGHIVRSVAEQGLSQEPRTRSPLIGQFESLLEQHFCDHWTLMTYADKLGVTPTHLTRLAKRFTGVPASKMIEARLIQEARRDLAYTSLTIAEIAYRIGYVDPAYFTRVFTRVTGMAPTAFRTQLERD